LLGCSNAGHHPAHTFFVCTPDISCMQDRDFVSAARLAFDLKHPGRLLSVIQRTAGSVAVGGAAGQEARKLLSGLGRRTAACADRFCIRDPLKRHCDWGGCSRSKGQESAAGIGAYPCCLCRPVLYLLCAAVVGGAAGQEMCRLLPGFVYYTCAERCC
jgi:hypothetical protein